MAREGAGNSRFLVVLPCWGGAAASFVQSCAATASGRFESFMRALRPAVCLWGRFAPLLLRRRVQKRPEDALRGPIRPFLSFPTKRTSTAKH